LATVVIGLLGLVLRVLGSGTGEVDTIKTRLDASRSKGEEHVEKVSRRRTTGKARGRDDSK
jgi:hypothetical protein